MHNEVVWKDIFSKNSGVYVRGKSLTLNLTVPLRPYSDNSKR
ncbi:hypothetical protein VAE151_550112 [Vibrio aestuarianus]|nr:hypothetical protein VAE055_370112 [Vibrio aestuarianus]CAH8192226.1 hypothetical protein VAE128_460112 [Vibrio aestuarianus]CAH8192444.1 hypothetical protein VAE130_570112 [Vibrio aestuarianus]CAH8192673.1 hypothetical protein VAE115_320111 [Vibrio aestuarianus]CAH8204106.1 hypothetical protein VAE151_550112 [Vibrio aestuarianus]